jgi:hypothetical protein
MISTDRYLIKGVSLTEPQKVKIVRQFLAAQSDERTKQSFYRSVKFPNNIDDGGLRMYPEFFIPPYNDGKKHRTLYNQTPTLHLLGK